MMEIKSGEEDETGVVVDSGELDSGDDAIPNIEGLNSLYMGHVLRRQAEQWKNMPGLRELRVIKQHRSFMVVTRASCCHLGKRRTRFKSNSTRSSDSGDIEMFGMTIFVDPEAPRVMCVTLIIKYKD